MAGTPLLVVEELRKRFGALEVLRGISLALEQGRKLAVLGPSGSGKSTLLRCINHLEVPDAGHVFLDGELIGERSVAGGFRKMSEHELAPQRAEIGMVFQGFYLWPHLTARENVAVAPQRVRGMSKPAALELAGRMLEKVHMAHKAGEFPERLSGGQQQRVAIARALAQEPKLLLFDEPTSALDPELIGEVLRVMEDLAHGGTTMIVVTHEMHFAQEAADRVVFMENGVIVEQGPPEQVLNDPQQVETRNFLRRFLQT